MNESINLSVSHSISQSMCLFQEQAHNAEIDKGTGKTETAKTQGPIRCICIVICCTQQSYYNANAP